MSVASGPNIVTNGLLFDYDMNNTSRSWLGAPTTNYIVSTPLTLTVYAYASGPVTTTNVIDASFVPRTVNRYTITSAVNTARARVIPTGLTTSVTYTFSCKIKYNGTNTVSPSFGVDASKGNPEGGANNNTVSTSTSATTSLGNGWYYVTYSWSYSSCPTGGCYLTYGVVTGSDTAYVNNTFDVYDEQFQVSTFATTYVTQLNGIRNNTQALLDVTGTSVATANSLVYNSDNTFQFIYSNPSTVQVPLATAFNKLAGTINVWIYPTSYNGGNGIFVNRTDTTANALDWLWIGPYSGTFYFRLGDGSTCCNNDLTISSYNSVVPVNTWTNLCCTWSSGGTSCIYINGSLNTSRSISSIHSTSPSANGLFGCGHANADSYYNGKMPVGQIYSRQLTAAEVMQNFNAYRRIYNI
jgi:hypothetical protein